MENTAACLQEPLSLADTIRKSISSWRCSSGERIFAPGLSEKINEVVCNTVKSYGVLHGEQYKMVALWPMVLREVEAWEKQFSRQLRGLLS